MENVEGKPQRFHGLRKRRKWLFLLLLLLLLLVGVYLFAPGTKNPEKPSAEPKALPPEVALNTPISTDAVLTGGSVTIVQTETGIKVTITNSTLANGTNVKVTSVFFGNQPPNGISRIIDVGIAYYDVKVTLASGEPLDSGAHIAMYISNPRFTNVCLLHYWDGNGWNSVDTQLVEMDTLLGPFKPWELTGTPIEVSEPVLPVLHDVPEVPLGTVAVAVVCFAAFVLFRVHQKKTAPQ
jgi:hypothetical protein